MKEKHNWKRDWKKIFRLACLLSKCLPVRGGTDKSRSLKLFWFHTHMGKQKHVSHHLLSCRSLYLRNWNLNWHSDMGYRDLILWLYLVYHTGPPQSYLMSTFHIVIGLGDFSWCRISSSPLILTFCVFIFVGLKNMVKLCISIYLRYLIYIIYLLLL